MKTSLTLVFSLLLVPLDVLHAAPQIPPPTLWAVYDPDKGDFKEEIVSQETKDGVYYPFPATRQQCREIERRNTRGCPATSSNG